MRVWIVNVAVVVASVAVGLGFALAWSLGLAVTPETLDAPSAALGSVVGSCVGAFAVLALHGGEA